jgi:AraC-like DNA-binding protein
VAPEIVSADSTAVMQPRVACQSRQYRRRAHIVAAAWGALARCDRPGAVSAPNGYQATLHMLATRDRPAPGAVAEANGISKRYLHHLFSQAHSTFGSELIQTRLDCARGFRKAYGSAPMAFRTAHLRGEKSAA